MDVVDVRLETVLGILNLTSEQVLQKCRRRKGFYLDPIAKRMSRVEGDWYLDGVQIEQPVPVNSDISYVIAIAGGLPIKPERLTKGKVKSGYGRC